jgi:CRP/FNR family transcriptional regulator
MPKRNFTSSRVVELHGCRPVTCRECGVYRLCVPLGLDSEEMTLLDRIVKRKQIVRRGQLLFRAGEPLHSVYAIQSGSVKTYLTTEDGRMQITGLLVPGELLGLSAIDSRRYSCDAMALETGSVCQISVDELEAVADRIPNLHYQMLRILSNQIRDNEQLMLLLGKRTAEERLAAFLLSLSRRLAARNFSPTCLRLSVSRGDIGNYLGVAEETVCRVLSRFQELGLIRVRRRQVELLELEKLRALAKEAAGAPLAQAARTALA